MAQVLEQIRQPTSRAPSSSRFSNSPSLWRWAGRYRVILYLALGLLLVDALVAAHRDIWTAYDPDDYRERVDGCARRPRDLVLVGGSPVCEGIDPGVLAGLSWNGQPLEHVYNLGLPGATTSDVWHAVRHGVATPPRLLVYGITASDINDARDEPHGPRSLMDGEDVAVWIRTRPDAGEWCVRHFIEAQLSHLWQLQRYRNGIRLWAADQVAQVLPDLFADAAGEARDGLRYSTALRGEQGYAPRPQFQIQHLDDLKAAAELIDFRFHFLEDYHLGGHLAYLHRLLDWASQNQVAVVLVDMPVSADLEERCYPEVFATYRAALANVAKERGLPVLHASRAAVGLREADFADLIHVNASGSRLLSAWLRQQLAADSQVPARQREPGRTR